jgi:hypothetical protein
MSIRVRCNSDAHDYPSWGELSWSLNPQGRPVFVVPKGWRLIERTMTEADGSSRVDQFLVCDKGDCEASLLNDLYQKATGKKLT